MKKRVLAWLVASALLVVGLPFALGSPVVEAAEPAINSHHGFRCYQGAHGVVRTEVLLVAICAVNYAKVDTANFVKPAKGSRWVAPGEGVGAFSDLVYSTGTSVFSGTTLITCNASNPPGSPDKRAAVTVGPYENDPFWGYVPDGYLAIVETVGQTIPAGGVAANFANAFAGCSGNESLIAGGPGGAKMSYYTNNHPNTSQAPTSTSQGTLEGWYGMQSFPAFEYVTPLPPVFSGSPEPGNPAACGSTIVSMSDNNGVISPSGHSAYEVTRPNTSLVFGVKLPEGYKITQFTYSIRWGNAGEWRRLVLLGPAIDGVYSVGVGDTIPPGTFTLSELQVRCEGPGGTRYGVGYGSPTDPTLNRSACPGWRVETPEGVELFKAGSSYEITVWQTAGATIESQVAKLAVRTVDDLGWIRNEDDDEDELDVTSLTYATSTSQSLPFTPTGGRRYRFDWSPTADFRIEEVGLVCFDTGTRHNRFGFVIPFDYGYVDGLEYSDPAGAGDQSCYRFEDMSLTSPSSWLRGIGQMGSCLVRWFVIPSRAGAEWAKLYDVLEVNVPFAWVIGAYSAVDDAVQGLTGAVAANSDNCFEWIVDGPLTANMPDEARGVCPGELAKPGGPLAMIAPYRSFIGVAVWVLWLLSLGSIIFPGSGGTRSMAPEDGYEQLRFKF